MGEFSPFHWLIVLAIVVLLFGGKKIPEVMKGLGEGIRSFKEGMHRQRAELRADNHGLDASSFHFSTGHRGKEIILRV